MVELVEVLQERNKDGKYDALIKRAKEGQYHDYKNTDTICGKMAFVQESLPFEELRDVREDIAAGKYDEEADASDKEEMRKGLPEHMWPLLGLD
jgi:hypothetical protein